VTVPAERQPDEVLTMGRIGVDSCPRDGDVAGAVASVVGFR
jgi:hypothetical protein